MFKKLYRKLFIDGIIIVVPSSLLRLTGYQYQGMATMAMVLYPFILLTDVSFTKNKFLMNHEKIHLRQQLELLVIPFYILYLFHYLFNLLKYKNHHKAYLNIVFEREAYQNERNLEYLKQRSLWAFHRFFFKSTF